MNVLFQRSDLLSLILVLLSLNPVLAGPYPRDDLHDAGFSYLQDRSCVTYCGAQNQYCCAAGQACYTNQINVAFCSANSGDVAGGYAVYTTTYTETNLILRTSTYTSSWLVPTTTWQPAPIVTPQPVCTSSLGESSCGNICCASDQRCAYINSCTAYTSIDQATTCTTFSAPFRPTSGDISTVSATTTVPFQPPATASGSIFPVTPLEGHHGLSGGAIAGIVIGVLAGVAILLLCCACCVLKKRSGGVNTLFAGKKKTRPNNGRINSAGSVISEKRPSSAKKNTIGASMGAALAAILAAIICFKLRKRRERASSSSISSSSISSSSSRRSSSMTSTESSEISGRPTLQVPSRAASRPENRSGSR